MIVLAMTGWWELGTEAAAVFVADPIYQVRAHVRQKWGTCAQVRGPYQHRKRHVAFHWVELSSLLQADLPYSYSSEA